jgi:outer membrane murein-binding lipoprotein Lpp
MVSGTMVSGTMVSGVVLSGCSPAGCLEKLASDANLFGKATNIVQQRKAMNASSRKFLMMAGGAIADLT